MIDPAETIPARIGITGEWSNGNLTEVCLDPYPEIVNRGIVRISVLALMADMMGGLIADQVSQHDWVFTTDLSVRAPELRVPASIGGTGMPLRAGKGTVHSEVQMRDERGDLFAYSHVGFVRMPRRYGDNPKPDIESAGERWGERPRIDRPLDVEAGIEVVDPATGHVEVELRDILRNPAGAMQGAMVALVAEVAAEALASHHLEPRHVVTELDVRYLAMGRIGPVWSRAAFIGRPQDATMHVELRDRGNADRLIAAVLARTTAVP